MTSEDSIVYCSFLFCANLSTGKNCLIFQHFKKPAMTIKLQNHI